MKSLKLIQILPLLLFVFAVSAQADSPVWKVQKGQHQLFIGGTIHVLEQTDYPLPPPFEKAYSESSKIVFETDMQKLKAPEFQQFMMKEMMYSDGRNLKKVLNRESFQALEEYCASRGIPVDTLLNFKPGMVSILLTVMEMQRLGMVGVGVDEFYSIKAMGDGKKTGQLETVEEQVAFLSSMGEGDEDKMISYTLRDIKILSEQMKAMKTAWRQGDLKELEKIALTPLMDDFPTLYNSMVLERNNAWVPQIEAMLKTKDVEFVLVGALHLLGEDGVLAQLAARGYDVQEL